MKLLIADDDRSTRIRMRHMIEKWGYDVIEADNGKTAIDILNSPEPPRLALLDWMMPEMEGVEVCIALAQDKEKPLVYRILITSKQEKKDIVTALDSGAHDFISKPVDSNELRSRIAVGKNLIQAEDKLKESQRQLSTLMSNLPGMAYRCLYDKNRTMEFVSDGALTLTGIPAEEWKHDMKLSFSTIIHPEDRNSVWEKIEKAIGRQKPYQCVYRIQTPESALKWVWEQGRGIVYGEQESFALEGFITDITERKRLEEALIESQKMEAIARLAGGIAHDFNNYFMIIRFYTESLLQSIPDDSTMKEEIITIQEIGQRASSLSKNLLAFSQNQPLKTEEINIHAFTPKLEKMLLPLLSESIKLEIHSSDTTGIIQANPGQIEQIIMNLVLNARDAIDREGTISIRSENGDKIENSMDSPTLEGPCVEISVQDTGAGIPKESQKHIFEPFFTTKSAGNETGLGLSIVYGIVKQLGGSIGFETDIGKGTTITLFLPRIIHSQSS